MLKAKIALTARFGKAKTGERENKMKKEPVCRSQRHGQAGTDPT